MTVEEINELYELIEKDKKIIKERVESWPDWKKSGFWIPVKNKKVEEKDQ